MSLLHSAVYEYQPSFILGFHGCDREVGESILSQQNKHLKQSKTTYDWLGSGIYFWEGNLTRAWEWAKDKHERDEINDPFVIGAIIDLRHCLDLFDRESIKEVSLAYELLACAIEQQGVRMPENSGQTPDLGGRRLDCSVINTLHQIRKDGDLQQYDSVRGPFLEGNPIYATAGFRSHTHIQICVRDSLCIKGYFRPLEI